MSRDAKGWDWDAALELMPGRWTRVADEVREFTGVLRRRGLNRVYDLGCGVGRHAVYLAAQGFDVIASDVSASSIEHTRSALDEAGVTAELHHCDMSHWPFADASLDAVIAVNVVYHATRAQLVDLVQQIVRCLVPGGMLYITFKSRADSDYRQGIELAPHTYAPQSGIERGIPHYYVEQKEIAELLDRFECESVEHRLEPPPTDDETRVRAHWCVVARKT